MARAKLSGSLLEYKDVPAAATPAQDVDPTGLDAEEKAPNRPVLVWLRSAKNDTGSNTAEGTADHQSGPRTLLRSASRAAVVAIVAVVGIGGFLLLQPGEGKRLTETALSVAPPGGTEKLQPPATAASVIPAKPAPVFAVANAAPAATTPPQQVLSDQPAMGAPSSTAPITADAGPAGPRDASPADPKVSGGDPGANRPAGEAVASRAPTEPPASAALVSALLERGDSLLALGDISSARLFYERAANAGNGQAALRLGETYDAAFLAQTPFVGARADATAATHWYQRARELGVAIADSLLAAAAEGHASP